MRARSRFLSVSTTTALLLGSVAAFAPAASAAAPPAPTVTITPGVGQATVTVTYAGSGPASNAMGASATASFVDTSGDNFYPVCSTARTGSEASTSCVLSLPAGTYSIVGYANTTGGQASAAAQTVTVLGPPAPPHALSVAFSPPGTIGVNAEPWAAGYTRAKFTFTRMAQQTSATVTQPFFEFVSNQQAQGLGTNFAFDAKAGTLYFTCAGSNGQRLGWLMKTTSMSSTRCESLLPSEVSFMGDQTYDGTKHIGSGTSMVSSSVGGMVVDTNGTLWVSDAGNNRVQKWVAGSASVAFGTGSAGSGLNQLSNPGQIAVDNNGGIYVVDTGNNRVMKFTDGQANGVVVAGGNGAGPSLNQLDSPRGAAVDEAGNLYVADRGNCRLVKWTPGASNGTVLLGEHGCVKGYGTKGGTIVLPAGDYNGPGTIQAYYQAQQKRLYLNAPQSGNLGYYDLTAGTWVQLESMSMPTNNGWSNYPISNKGLSGSDPVGQVALAPDGRLAMRNYASQLYLADFSGERITCDISLTSYADATVGKALAGCIKNPITPNDRYIVDAVFYNSYGEGAHTAAFGLTPRPYTQAPHAPLSPAAHPSYKAVTVSWTPATTGQGASSYTATLQPGGATCTAQAPATSCKVTGLTVGTRYAATVVATNSMGSSPASAKTSEATPYDLPGAISAAPSVVAGARSATVTWVAPTTGGTVRSYTATASPGGATCTVDAPATSCKVTGLTPGSGYTFSVTASNEGGAGSASPASSSATVFDKPGQPGKPSGNGGNAGLLVQGSSTEVTGGSPITSYTATVYDPDGNAAGSCDYQDPNVGCTVSDLVNGKAYTIKVVANNAGGGSDPSPASNPVTPSGPPSAPGNLRVTGSGDRSIALTWNVPPSDGGSAITSYVVTQFPSGGSCSVDSSARTAQCSGLTNGASYSFNVAAVSASGIGPNSNAATGTPAAVPSAPLSPTIKAGNGTVTVNWKKPASDGGSAISAYTVTVGGRTCVTATLTCTIIGLANGTPVSAVVKATNAAGDSPSSTTSASVTPNAAAGAPANAPANAPTLTSGNAKLDAQLQGSLPAGATSVVFTASPGGASCVATKAPLGCSITGLANGVTYDVTAAYANAKGLGPQSAASSGAPTGPASAPQNLSVTGSNGVMDVSWTPPASNGGGTITTYQVTVKDSKGKVAGGCTYTVAGQETDTCTVTGLSTSELYSVEVLAVSDKGSGAKATLSGILVSLAFNALTAPSANLQVAVGDRGRVYRSSDAGAHWSMDSTPTLENLRSVSCGGGSSFCMAVGDNGTVLTWDAAIAAARGDNVWAPISSGTSQNLNGVFCITDGACMGVGNGSTVITSSPQSLKAAPTSVKLIDGSEFFSGGDINAITCTNPKAPARPVCVAGGAGGKLISVAWKGVGTGFGQPTAMNVAGVSTDINALRCSVDTNCVAVGKAGLVLSGTKDISKASNWKKIGSIKGFDASLDLRGVACPALGQLCLAVGNSGTLLVSNPKAPAGPGTTGWTPIPSLVTYDLTKVRCVSANACLGIGGGHLLQVVLAKTGKWVVRQVA